jgi:hypothetical protein
MSRMPIKRPCARIRAARPARTFWRPAAATCFYTGAVSTGDVAPSTIIAEPTTPFGVAAQRLQWDHDPEAYVSFVLQPHSAYILWIQRGAVLSGTGMLEIFRSIALDRRIKVVGVTFDSLGFWEKMVERQLVSDWCLDEPRSLLG